MASRAADSPESVVISFRENLAIPRFPEPAIGEERDSETNKRVQARNAEIIEGLRARRSENYKALQERLSQYGARVTGSSGS